MRDSSPKMYARLRIQRSMRFLGLELISSRRECHEHGVRTQRPVQEPSNRASKLVFEWLSYFKTPELTSSEVVR